MRITTDDLRRVPIIGGDIAQIGQVLDITGQPCSPDPYIAVKATFAYLPTLVWSLVKPDPLDMAFDRAGRPHSRKGRRRMNVSGVMQLAAPTSPGLSMNIFRLGQLAQRVGWWFLILDATTDYAINWTSMLYQWSGCRSNLAGWAKTSGGSGALGGSTQTSAVHIGGGSPTWQSPGYAEPGTVQINQVGPKTCSASFTVEAEPYGGTGEGIIGAELQRNPFTPSAKNIPMSGGPGGYGTSTFHITEEYLDPSTPVTTYQMRVKFEKAKLELKDMSMSMDGAPPGGILHDP